MDFDALRQRAESFSQNLNHALYQRHTGVLADIPLKQVYEAPGIFTRDTILELANSLAAAPEADRPRLRMTWRFLVEGYLRLNAADYDEELARRYDQLTESGAWARHDALNAFSQLGQQAPEETSAELFTLYSERWATLGQSLQQVGFDLLSYLELIGGGNPLCLAAEAKAYLAETADTYVSALADLRRQAGPIQGRIELETALAGPQFAYGFPLAEQVPTIEDTLYHLGIDVTRQPNLALEINRSLQPGSAMAFPVRVPEEIYLVVSPTGGLNAYEQFLRVTGMIMPKLLLSPKLPWATRRLADHGVAEAFGEIFAGLLGNGTWLADLLKLDDSVNEFVDFYRFRRLYHLRRAAARLIHLVDRARGQDDYTAIFEGALGVKHSPNTLWLDMGWQRRALATWQGLQRGVQLESALIERHGPRWYRDTTASAELRELWASGLTELSQIVLP